MNVETGSGEHRELVREAARFLDDRWPQQEVGESWYDAVNLRLLRMASTCRCVCGQLGARLARHEGYVLRDPLDEPKILLDGPRVVPLAGFDVLHRHRGDLLAILELVGGAWREVLRSELELVDLLRKRLGVDECNQERVIPGELHPAFWGSTPVEWWREEILARRSEWSDTYRTE